MTSSKRQSTRSWQGEEREYSDRRDAIKEDGKVFMGIYTFM